MLDMLEINIRHIQIVYWTITDHHGYVVNCVCIHYHQNMYISSGQWVTWPVQTWQFFFNLLRGSSLASDLRIWRGDLLHWSVCIYFFWVYILKESSRYLGSSFHSMINSNDMSHTQILNVDHRFGTVYGNKSLCLCLTVLGVALLLFLLPQNSLLW